MASTTKRALAESLKKLLSKRPLDKITVKDIVEDCGVNRQTFYYHFHDIYDLLDWVFQDIADTLMQEKIDYNDWHTGVETVMKLVYRERLLVLHTYHSISHEAVSRNLEKLMRPYILEVVRQQAGQLERAVSEENMAFATDIYTLMASGMMLQWIGGKMQMEQTAQRLQKLYTAMDGSILLMLRNLSEG